VIGLYHVGAGFKHSMEVIMRRDAAASTCCSAKVIERGVSFALSGRIDAHASALQADPLAHGSRKKAAIEE